MVRRLQRRSGWLFGLLPEGIPLPDEAWAVRHRVISALAVAHVPAIFVFALIRGVGLEHALFETAPVAFFSIAGRRVERSRTLAEICTTIALVTSSAVLVHLSGGYIEFHFHFFVIVALVTLYQQWPPFLVAIVYVLVHHGIAGAVAPESVFNHPDAIAHPWRWAAVHALFISMASAVGIANWKLNELARQQSRAYYRELYEGEKAVVRQLEEADRVKSELLAIVSHEFRTPLTAIIGFSHAMKRATELRTEQIVDFAGRTYRQGKRLERLVENLLEAEKVVDPVGGSCEAETAVEASIAAATDGFGRSRDEILVDVTPGLVFAATSESVQLVLLNLLVNAMKFATPGTPVVLSVSPFEPAGLSRGRIAIEVTNAGPEIPAHLRERIFQPFVQGDSSNTRQVDGVGLGLHIVRRVVEAHDGAVAVESDAGATTFRAVLPGVVEAAVPPAQGAEPAATT